MNRKIRKSMTVVAALLAATATLSGCFHTDGPSTFTTGDVIIEGKITDYYQQPINKVPNTLNSDSVMVVLYRVTTKDQTIAVTPNDLICDTCYADKTGWYQVKDADQTEISNVYGLYIADAANAFRFNERYFLSQEAKIYERNNKYELVTRYDCILYPHDWAGFEDNTDSVTE